ncbi:MAG: cation-translocating P-type ATPase [Chlamydiia bacterium]
MTKQRQGSQAADTLLATRRNDWHALPVDEVLAILQVDRASGLHQESVRHRQAEYGLNRPTPRARRSRWRRLFDQLIQPLDLLLLVAAIIAAAVADWVDCGIIVAVVLIMCGTGYFQEDRAERALDSLKAMAPHHARVLRDGTVHRLSAEELVPGDIILLSGGDRIPADLRLTEAIHLTTDESSLTGESNPANKHVSVLSISTPLAERACMVYGGTFVATGKGMGVVVETGDRTEIGRIARLVSHVEKPLTPLGAQLDYLSRWLLLIIGSLATLAFVIGVAQGESMQMMLMASLAMTVSMIPEGLPAALTITLAIGVVRMARRRAIIRHLPAVETLGSCTMICSDKTGTLTTNQMTVEKVYAGLDHFTLAPDGRILHAGKRVDLKDHVALQMLAEACALAREHDYTAAERSPTHQGDPTEAALVSFAQRTDTLFDRQLIDLLPFDSKRGNMAVLIEIPEENRLQLWTKGGPERILPGCAYLLNQDGQTVPMDAATIQQAADQLAEAGYRVLAFATKDLHASQTALQATHLHEGLTFVGLVGLQDPPRADAHESLMICRTAGIQVKMITGDHPLTAKAIATQLAILPRNSPHMLIVGSRLEQMSDEELGAAARDCSVFARVTPEQKYRLVQALQKQGEVVAMTGDGVNDAPALRQADIGVAMGLRGTDVARQSSDMVLTDDCFGSIVAAIEEGRGVYDTLCKVLLWTLPTNCAEGLLVLIAMVLGMDLPLLPIQLLWINLTTAVVLGLTLVFEPPEPDLMQRPPRTPSAVLWTRPLQYRTVLVACLMLTGAFWQFWMHVGTTPDTLAVARTVVVNTIILCEAAYLLACRSLLKSFWQLPPFSNHWLIVGIVGSILVQLAFTYLPFMQSIFQTRAVDLVCWGESAAIAIGLLAIVELEKAWQRRRVQRKA